MVGKHLQAAALTDQQSCACLPTDRDRFSAPAQLADWPRQNWIQGQDGGLQQCLECTAALLWTSKTACFMLGVMPHAVRP